MQKYKIEDMMPKSEKFQGVFRAVIENNLDPEKLGRVQVRIFGIHSQNKNPTDTDGIKTEDLPWAEPALLPIEGGMGGYGLFSVPKPGSHVFLFFEGGNIQRPVYFAVAPGKPAEKSNPKDGFNDPTGVYPPQHRVGQSDFHNLARGETKETIVDHKETNKVKGITNAVKETYNEPTPPNKTTYPNNIVTGTSQGIVQELDSTPGEERIHMYHPSNSFIEFSNADNWKAGESFNKVGTLVTKSGQKFEEVVNISRLNVGDKYDLVICGDLLIKVGGKIVIDCDKTIDITAKDNITIKGANIFLN